MPLLRFTEPAGTCCTTVGPRPNPCMPSPIQGMWRSWTKVSWRDGLTRRGCCKPKGNRKNWLWSTRIHLANNAGRGALNYVAVSRGLNLAKTTNGSNVWSGYWATFPLRVDFQTMSYFLIFFIYPENLNNYMCHSVLEITMVPWYVQNRNIYVDDHYYRWYGAMMKQYHWNW